MDFTDGDDFNADNPNSDDANDTDSSEPRDKRRRRSATPVNVRRARGELSSKEKKSLQKDKVFQDTWLQDSLFKDWLKKVPGQPEQAMCTCCGKTLKAGKSELEKHGATQKHKDKAKSLAANRTLDSMVDGTAKKHADAVKTAEIHMAAFFAENNVAFLAADQLVGVQKKAFPDSKIVKDMKLGRDKCNAIVRNVIAKVETEDLVKDLRKHLFTVLLDESTDPGNDKGMCLLCLYIPESGKPTVGLLELLRLDPKDCSAEKLWGAFEECLGRHQIPVTNVMGMATDSAPVFVGRNNSFWTRLKAACPWAVLLPCVCHSVAQVSKKACAKLPVHVEEHLRLVSTYMNDSPKRSAELKEFQAFYEEELTKVLKPSGTRWLVLHSCVARYLAIHTSLSAFFELRCFEDKNKKDKDAHKILYELKNPFTKAYLQFLDYALNVTNQFNALFQSKNVLIHKMYELSHDLMKTLCSNFLKDGLADHLASVNVTHPHNMKPLEDVVLGPECWATLNRLVPNSTLPEATAQLERDKLTFRRKCLDFYTTAAEEIQKRLPLKDQLIKEMSFLDPAVLFSPAARSGPTGMSGIDTLVTHYKEKLQLDTTALAYEWRRIPNEITGDRREKLSSLPIEELWVEMKAMKNGLGQQMFPNLAKLADVVLIMPHANADSERCFSIVTDVRTKKRNRMGGESLNAICVTRIAFKAKGIDCVSFKVRKEHLQKHNVSMYERGQQN